MTDLQDTLQANRAGCVGMAVKMIGVKKRVIIVILICVRKTTYTI